MGDIQHNNTAKANTMGFSGYLIPLIIILGNYITMNIFLAILNDAYGGVKNELLEKEEAARLSAEALRTRDQEVARLINLESLELAEARRKEAHKAKVMETWMNVCNVMSAFWTCCACAGACGENALGDQL